jgi:hypothetical protein
MAPAKWKRVGKKNAKYVTGLLKPLISWIKQTKDPNNQKTDHWGVVDLVLFDGASNVQNVAKLVSITYPRITNVHGAECWACCFPVLKRHSQKCKCLYLYPCFQSGVKISLHQFVMILIPSSRSAQSCTIMAFTLVS